MLPEFAIKLLNKTTMMPPSLSPRRHLESLPPYTPIEPFEVLSGRLGREPQDIIKLDANENPYGLSPKAREALANLKFPHIYPDPESRKLRQALSDFTGVPSANLIAGAGADELIDLLIRLLIEPGERVLIFPPTFGMYAFDSHVNDGQIIQVERILGRPISLDDLLEAVDSYQPKIIFLATPNNPDGNMLDHAFVQGLLNLPVLTVLDEAYIEFSNGGRLGEISSHIRHVPGRNNLVVLRTFSKWAGLAGLRVGYGAFPDWMMPTIWKAKQPYNVNYAASEAALASLQDLDYHSQVVTQLKHERQRLFDLLSAIDWLRPYPSQGNFILCQVLQFDASMLKNILARDYGIIIRYFDKPGLQDHIRISVGRPEDTDVLIHALNLISSQSGDSEYNSTIP